MRGSLLGTGLLAGLFALGVASCTVVFGDFQLRSTSGTGGTTTGSATCGAGVQACTGDTDCPAPASDCVVRVCDQGCCATTNAPQGATCAQGQCDGNGTCASVGCGKDADCTPPVPNPCVTPTCNASIELCSYPPLQDGTPTPGVTESVGDCHKHICLGGADVDQVDDTDAPAAMGDCQDPTCNAGSPVQKPRLADTVCSTFMTDQPGFCDGAGKCVQCSKDSECPGSTDDCQHPACVNNLCTVAHATAGTATSGNPPQIQGDCQKVVCDGSGNHNTSVDNSDLPADATGCQPGTCTAGVPGHTQATNGTPCGAGLSCISGMCSGCTTNAQCTAPSTCGGGGTPNVCGCTKTTCALQGATCGAVSDGCVAMLNCDDAAKDGAETDVDCGGNPTKCATRCAQGKKCGATSDCQSGLSCVDGVCCNSPCTGTCQACTAAKKGQGSDGVCGAIKLGTDPDLECSSQAVSTCGRSGGCSGAGACSTYPNGTVCQAASCMGAGTLTKADTCSAGVCAAPVPPTQDCTPYLCSSGACGTSCNNDAQCVVTAFCNAAHQCVFKLTAGTSGCAGNSQCTSGVCGTNGVCCVAACTSGGVCGATGCAVGSGACSYPSSGTTCNTTCMSGILTVSQCDGAGSCPAGTPAACVGHLLCASGTACATGCGTNDAVGDSKCAGGYWCDGAGAGSCQPAQATGSPCNRDNQCINGCNNGPAHCK